MLLAECMVCFDTLESDKDIYAAKCGHVLHYTCWMGCLRTSTTCPKCRKLTRLGDLIKLFISYSEKEDSASLQNKIDELRCELSCKAADFERIEEELRVKTFEYRRLCTEIERLKCVESEIVRVTENLKRREKELETLKRLKDETLELKKVKADLEKFKEQSFELRKVKAELEKLRKEPKTRSKTNEEIEKIRKYQGVVEGLKQCLHEFDQIKKSNQLVKKLKIYTDDISGDVKNDVKKDPQKYVDMFQEVKKFWNWVGKREEEGNVKNGGSKTKIVSPEIKRSPKGCVIHLTGFPPDRKDVTKLDIQARFEYYDAEVAFITYARGEKEAFVRLKPPRKVPADKQNDPADKQNISADKQNNPVDLQKSPAEMVVEKLKEGKLRIKNFTVNAVVLEGEAELKFLRRSFDDRDRKIGRVNCDLDYFDDSQEVSMLEYMMNLVALA